MCGVGYCVLASCYIVTAGCYNIPEIMVVVSTVSPGYTPD